MGQAVTNGAALSKHKQTLHDSSYTKSNSWSYDFDTCRVSVKKYQTVGVSAVTETNLCSLHRKQNHAQIAIITSFGAETETETSVDLWPTWLHVRCLGHYFLVHTWLNDSLLFGTQ